MEAKHTKGPWSINDWPQNGTDIAIGAVGTPLIAKVPLRDVSINEQRANAEFIVRAANAHDALVEALEAVTNELESRLDGMSADPSEEAALELARAALAKAKRA